MLIAQRPTLSEETVDEFRSRFVIEPLEPGFGYTLGNSLRRTLLSSIPGASVTSIRVDSVLHEFSTIEGVKEDVTEVILNLKGLVVSSEHDEPVTMYLRKSGAGDVTAADITPPAGVEVHNPDLKIATLSDKGKLEMELVVERGRGYVSAVQNKGADNEIGRMPVDSIYSPVLKVTYKVGVVHLDASRRRDVGRGHLTGARLAQVHRDGLVVLGGDDEALEVQDHLGDVLLDALDGRELVEHRVDLDARDRGTGDRREQGATQRVAERVAEAGLQRLDDEPRTELVDGLFRQGGALCDEHLFFPFRARPLFDVAQICEVGPKGSYFFE